MVTSRRRSRAGSNKTETKLASRPSRAKKSTKNSRSKRSSTAKQVTKKQSRTKRIMKRPSRAKSVNRQSPETVSVPSAASDGSPHVAYTSYSSYLVNGQGLEKRVEGDDRRASVVTRSLPSGDETVKNIVFDPEDDRP
jgi:hypothetical protein